MQKAKYAQYVHTLCIFCTLVHTQVKNLVSDASSYKVMVMNVKKQKKKKKKKKKKKDTHIKGTTAVTNK